MKHISGNEWMRQLAFSSNTILLWWPDSQGLVTAMHSESSSLCHKFAGCNSNLLIWNLFTIKPTAAFNYSLFNFFLFNWFRIQLPINSWKLNCGVYLISYFESLRLKDARLEARLLVQQQPSLIRICSQSNIEEQVSAAFEIAHSQVHQFLTLTNLRSINWYQVAMT